MYKTESILFLKRIDYTNPSLFEESFMVVND